jgi:hypothetical protein
VSGEGPPLALAFYNQHGIRVERLLTDNGSAYRPTIHALACKTIGIRHLRTATPSGHKTSGKPNASSAGQQLGLRHHLPLTYRTHRT